MTGYGDARRTELLTLICFVAAYACFWPAAAEGQSQFGLQDRADAAKRMIVLAVQQAISSLPPTSAQFSTFELDPKLDSVAPSKHPGPIVLRSPQPMPKGLLAFRLSASYFDLDESLGPIDYRIEGPVAPKGPLRTKFGLDASVKAGVIAFAASYGIMKNLEVNLTLPVVVTSVQSDEVFVTEPGSNVVFAVPFDPPGNIERLIRNGDLTIRRVPLRDVGASFGDGDHVGVGRIDVGAKMALYPTHWLQLGFAPEFLFPSPSEDEFAGSDSAAILPRVIAAIVVTPQMRVRIDAGYEYDFDADELSRLVWSAGASMVHRNLAVDIGVGGSKFNQGVTWTPDRATFLDLDGNPNSMTAVGDNQLGSNFVDFIAGVKLQVAEAIAISGAVSVPVNDEGVRPAVMGTIGLEIRH